MISRHTAHSIFVRISSFIMLISLITGTAFSQSPENNSYIQVKFTPEFISSVETATVQFDEQGILNIGIREIDSLAQVFRLENMERVFPYNERFDKRHRGHGLHLWYRFTSSSVDFSPMSCASSFENCDFINLSEAPLEKYFNDGYEEGDIMMMDVDDPRFDQQWHYENTGQTGGTTDADIDLSSAWDIQAGQSDVIVAVIDGGIDVDHEDLADNMWVNEAELNGTAGVDDDGNGYVDDVYGYSFGDDSGTIGGNNHGTHVGGTVGAVNDNGTGVSGVAGGTGTGDGVRLMSCATFGQYRTGGFDAAFVYAADNGAVISQNSWGYTSPGVFEQSVLDAIDYFIENAGYDADGNPDGPMQGGLVIFAAGNSNSSAAYYPGYYAPVMAVASTDHNDVRSSFSNYGSWVDIAAPGSNVLSTFPNNTYGSISGTSMACPHVSGAAALIVSEYGGDGLEPDQVRDRLEGISDDIDDSNPSFVGLLGSGRLNAHASLQTDTGEAPDAISDLSSQNTTGVSVELTWTASGSNGSTGTARSYDIRYSTSNINESNFSSALEAEGVPDPQASGSAESFVLDGLAPVTTYYVAIKVSNVFGNTSDISNVLQFTTSDVPEITVDPDSLVAILDTGESSTLTFTISNTGDEDLDFNMPLFNQNNNEISVNNTSLIDFGGWEPKKGEIDTRQGHPVLNGSGNDGEDGFGYSWIDSDEANGPSFEWTDIRVDGQQASLGDDSYVTVALPFEFEFYGEVKNEVYISSNGFLTFNTSGATRWSNAQIPGTSIPNDLIALFWDDLYPRGAGTVHYLVENNQLTVQYTDIGYFGNSAATLTFQAILFANGTIKFQYLNVDDDRRSATIGIENSGGTDGLQVAFNTSYLSDSLAIRISAVPDFITNISPSSGTVTAGDEVEVSVSIDATGIEPGNYESGIGIESNDPVSPSLSLPILLHVNGAPALELSQESLDFETVFTDESDSILLSLRNIGTDTLSISGLNVTGNFFSMQSDDLPLNILPREESVVTVFYSPTAVGDHSGTLEIETNVTSNPDVEVSLAGTAQNPPILSISPTTITEALNSGDSSGVVLTIQNNASSGAAALDFEVAISNETNTSNLSTTDRPNVKMPLPPTEHAFVEKRLFVTVREDLSEQQVASLLEQYSVSSTQHFKYISAQVWQFSDLSVEAAMGQMYNDDRILFAEPDYIVEAIDRIPDDARYEDLWGMNNTGQTGGTADADIDALEAWGISTDSRDIVVGIIDTGIDYNHEDLNDNIWINEDEVANNGVDDDGNGYIDDVYGWDFVNEDNDPMDGHSHGTHVAGTVGGEGDNGIGVVGVTWNVQLMALKFLSDFGSGNTTDAIEAIEYAIENGADITNNSWGGGGFSNALRDAIAAANDDNQLFVAAAGNSGLDADRFPHYPSSYEVENVISVAATDHNDRLASFSNYGLTSVDLAAPGVSILSAVPNDSYSSFSGTSMAAPHVAGALALAWGRDRTISNLELKEVLFESVDSVTAVQGRSVTGGRLNVNEMLGGLNSWLSIDVTSGSLDPGTSATIDVSLNAASLIGGEYNSNIVVSTNDPDNPSFTVPVQLNVTGVPNISIDQESLVFDALFLGDTLYLSVEISNVGTDVLSISEISIANTEFGVDTTSLELSSGEAYDLSVSYIPETLGEITSSLVILSNDSDESEISIPVSGTGLEPPVLVVSPDSIGEALFTGEVETRQLTIDNSTGGSSLTWALSTAYEGISNYGSTRASIGFYADPNRIVNATEDLPFELASAVPPQITSELSILDTLENFTTNSTGVEVVGDTIYVVDWSNNELNKYYLPNQEIVEVIDIHSLPYGICYLDGNLYIGDNSGVVRIYSLSGELIGNFDAPTSGYQALTTNGQNLIMTRSFTSGSEFFEVDVTGDVVNTFTAPAVNSYEMVWVRDDLWVLSSRHTLYRLAVNDLTLELADTIEFTNPGGLYSYSLGHNGDDLVFDSWYPQAYVLDDFQASFSWVSVSEESGEVDAGASITLDVTFDAAGLNGGLYEADLVIESNDPQSETLAVPVAIEVTGAPDITVSPETLDFGTVFVGYNEEQRLIITNDGTDLLSVSDIQLGNGDYTIDASDFDLDPGESLSTIVTYTPSSVENDDSEITITSNDNDEGSLTVQLEGQGVDPPVLTVDPDSVGVALFTGETSTAEITFDNTAGGSALTWELTSEYRRSTTTTTRSNNIGFYADPERLTGAENMLPESHEDRTPVLNSELVILDTLENFARNSTGVEVVRDTVYVLDWSNSDLIKYYLPDQQIVETIDIHSSPYGITFMDGNLYIGDSRGVIRIYTLSGEVVGNFNAPGSGYNTVTSNGENLILGSAFSTSAPLYEVDVTGTILSTYVTPSIYRTEIVWVREDLWVLSNSHRIYRFSLDDLTFQVEDTIQAAGYASFSYSLGHDGDDLVFDSWQEEAYVIEDFQDANNWLSLTEESGEVDAGTSSTVEINLDASGLNGGIYEAQLTITSNDPANEELMVPVAIEVTGAPDIEVSPSSLEFGSRFIGYDHTKTITITNSGTDLLEVSDIAITNSDFSVGTNAFDLDVDETFNLVVTYNPGASGNDTAELSIISNDTDEGTLVIQLSGEGVEPPVMSINPDSIGRAMFTGESHTQILTIDNSNGGSELEYEIAIGPRVETNTLDASPVFDGSADQVVNKNSDVMPEENVYEFRTVGDWDPSLELSNVDDEFLTDFLTELTENVESINTLIPNRFDFSGGETGYSISDGGRDMYDGGNWLTTDTRLNMAYTNSQIQTSTALNGGSYLTAKYPGLFVFAGDVSEISYFEIYGNLGADGGGSVDGSVLSITRNGREYLGFVKRVYNAYDPSINHLIVVENTGSLAHTFSTNTNSDLHQVTGLDNSEALYYLLYASENGGYIDDESTLSIMGAFLDVVQEVSSNFVTVASPTGSVAAGSAVDVEVVLDASGLNGGLYEAALNIQSNDPANETLTVPVAIDVTGAPDIGVSARQVDFGGLFVGLQVSDTITVTNEGTDQLVVSELQFANSDFSAETTSFQLGVGETQDVIITYGPTAVGTNDSDLQIISNDSDEGTLTVQLTGTGLAAPSLVVSPDSVGETLRQEETSTRVLTIDNSDGGADLTWSISTSTPGQASWFYDTSDTPASTVKKGEEPTTAGPPQLFGSGGPDTYGYSWIDSNESGGPAFTWEDISSTGLNITSSMRDDNVTGPYDLGFEFDFYGITYTEFSVSSNGFIQFGTTGSSGCCSGQPLPRQDNINNIIAWAWRDGFPFGNTYYQNYDDRTVIQFDGYGLCCSQSRGSATAQVIIYSSGDIKINYQSLTGSYTNGGHSVGIENADGTDGLQVAYNTDYLQDGLSILFSRGARWLTLGSESGTIAAGSSETVDLIFNASGLNVGTVELDLQVTSNDPLNPMLEIPVTLEVLGSPDISVTETNLSFGENVVGTTNSLPLYITNSGSAELVISDFVFDVAYYSVDIDSLNVPGNSSDTIQVNYNPEAVGDHSGALTIVSNDPDEGSFNVSLSASAYGAPEITVSADTVNLGSAVLNGSVNSEFFIFNTGSETLTISEILVNGADFSVEWSTSSLAIGDTATAILTFTPSVIGQTTGNLRILSNDPNKGDYGIHLEAEGLDNNPQVVYGSDTLNITAGIPVSYHMNQFFVDPLGLDLSFEVNQSFTIGTYELDGDTITVTGNEVGRDFISVIATNTEGRQGILELIVEIMNADPAVIGSVDTIRIAERQSISINLYEIFGDANDEILTFSGTSDEGVGLGFSNGGSMIVTGESVGIGTIIVTATDAFQSSVSDTIAFEVTPREILSIVGSLDRMIYPNPSQGVLHIDQQAILEIETIEVIDFLGKKLDFSFDRSEGMINLQGLSEGVYFLRLKLVNDELLIKKFVISFR